MLAVVLFAAAGCSPQAVTLDQAKALTLAAPNIRTAVRIRGAKPIFEWIDETPRGWRFDINSDTPCECGAQACSKLLGHYWVGRDTGEVYDLDADGGEGARVSSPNMNRLRIKFGIKRC